MNLINDVRTAYLCRYYKDSPKKSLGQVLSFLYVFCGFDVMERVQVGDNKVYLDGNIIAIFNFNDDGMPFFYFRECFEGRERATKRQMVFFENKCYDEKID